MLTELIHEPAAAAALAGLLVTAALAGAWLARRTTRPAPRRRRADAASDADPVTGLMERARFEQILVERIASADRAGSDLCVLHVGLDGFRIVNDTHGHEVGDQVLRATAARLRGLCGASTALSRVGGDEFAIAFSAPGPASEVLARRLVEAFGEPLDIEGQAIPIGISVGMAIAPEHGNGPRLIAMAAAAMRWVKHSGGGSYATFDPRIEAQQRAELGIARDLRHAIEKRELELVYQPKIDAVSMQVTGVEALLRWRHPKLGVVAPMRFVPIAEKHGLIEAIGNWVLDSALKQAADWNRIGLSMRVAVNLSGYQIRQDDFAARLEKGLKANGLQPAKFTCEITEAVATENTAVTRNALARLAKIGVQIAIDDFGSGHSGLSTLRRLPAQELKLDQALVSAIGDGVEAQAAVEAVVKTAHAHHLKVVAEGVETEPQRSLLVQLGCDELQGYLFAKPMSARAIAIWVADAPTALAQTFKPTLFQETMACYPPTELMSPPTIVEPRGARRVSAG
jgi:diguanylate cyclase (GGDEF)-like protein